MNGGRRGSMVLMLKDEPVYNIDTEVVYNTHLLPGLLSKAPCKATFKMWMKLRYSSNSNSLARELKGLTFGQGNRVAINKETRALSLCDCYWIKDIYSQERFYQISPYYNSFWNGLGPYDGGSVPTLYVNGYLTKEWVSSNYLLKYGKSTLIEVECSQLCKACGIPVADVSVLPDKTGVAVSNITNANFMLEQADQSGLIDVDDFTDVDIFKLFNIPGLDMLTIDAIVGNGDRHAGNFGWLRDTSSGRYVSMAPLYDFDHALDSTSTSDILITSLLDLLKIYIKHKSLIDRVTFICNKTLDTSSNEIFKCRAKGILLCMRNL